MYEWKVKNEQQQQEISRLTLLGTVTIEENFKK
jgi:hypothetical protein